MSAPAILVAMEPLALMESTGLHVSANLVIQVMLNIVTIDLCYIDNNMDDSQSNLQHHEKLIELLAKNRTFKSVFVSSIQLQCKHSI